MRLVPIGWRLKRIVAFVNCYHKLLSSKRGTPFEQFVEPFLVVREKFLCLAKTMGFLL